MTDPIRQPAPGAVHASPVERPFWLRLARSAAIAAGVGGFLAFIGAFGTDRMGMGGRLALMIPLSWAGAALGFASYRLTEQLPPLRGRIWLTAAASGVLMAVPMALIVFFSVQLVSGRAMPLSDLPGFITTSLVTSVAITLMSVGLSTRHKPHVIVTLPEAPAPPRFLERLPLKLRGAEVWAVESEDHYLRLHTSKGQDLILMRLADAVAELEGVEGAQVHRSWWVARDAIAGAERGDGRATLTLKDGSQVPVSRTYAKILRDRNWI